MEPEIQSTEIGHVHPAFKVTMLSKYLAMILFILLPFVGGYIGYMYAPEKAVEVKVEKEVKEKKTVEKTDSEKLSEWSLANDFAQLNSIFSERTLSMDIGPYSDKILTFTVVSQVPVYESRVLIDYLHFDENTGLISLKDYWGEGGDVNLLQLYKPSAGQDLETYLEDIIIGVNKADEESLAEYIRHGLRKRFTENELANINFRSFCRLSEDSNDDWVSLSVDENKYGEFNALDYGPAYPCGPQFRVLDGILIRNYAQHVVDATEPQVKDDFRLEENTSYISSVTGERVYKYPFQDGLSE